MRTSKSGMFECKGERPLWGLIMLSLVSTMDISVASAEEAQGSRTFATLLAQFANMPGLEARFREEKHIALLEAPLISEGSLHFTPPGMLLRQIRTPASSTVLIRDGRLQFRDDHSSGQIDLDANPVVRHFVESFVLLLSGDEAALRRLYTITFTPTDDGWSILLVPRPEPMRRALREVRLRGAGTNIREMRVLEVSGDQTVTTFTNVDPARRYSEAERSRLFRLPSP